VLVIIITSLCDLSITHALPDQIKKTNKYALLVTIIVFFARLVPLLSLASNAFAQDVTTQSVRDLDSGTKALLAN
jgi:hypothetical protein